MIKELEKLYAQVPYRNCPEGCCECCGPVPWGPAEQHNIGQWLAAQGRHMLKINVSNTADLMQMQCPYVQQGRCSIYEVRPMLCRLFGVVVHKNLICDKGKARIQMSRQLAAELMNQVHILDYIASMNFRWTDGPPICQEC